MPQNSICPFCLKEDTFSIPIGFKTCCETCNEYIHTCITCKSFDEKRNMCINAIGEPGRSPSEKNYCEAHEFSSKTIKNKSNTSDKKEESKKKLNDLFKF